MLFPILIQILFPIPIFAGPFSPPRLDTTTSPGDHSDAFVTENIILGTATAKYSTAKPNTQGIFENSAEVPPEVEELPSDSRSGKRAAFGSSSTRGPALGSMGSSLRSSTPPSVSTQNSPLAASSPSPWDSSSAPIRVQTTTQPSFSVDSDPESPEEPEEPWDPEERQKLQICPKEPIQLIPLTSTDGRTAKATLFFGKPPQRLNISISTFYHGLWVPEEFCYSVAEFGSDAFNRSNCAAGALSPNVYRPNLTDTQIEHGFFQHGKAVGVLVDDDVKFGDLTLISSFGSVRMVVGDDSGLLGLSPRMDWEEWDDKTAAGLFQTAWRERKIRKPMVAIFFNYANDSGIGEGPELQRADAGQIIVGNDAPDHCQPSLDADSVPQKASVFSGLPDFAGWIFTAERIAATAESRNATVDLNSDWIMGPLDEVRRFAETLKESGAMELEEGRFAVKCSAEFEFGFSQIDEIRIPSSRLLRRKCDHCKELDEGLCYLAISGLKSKTPANIHADWIIGGKLMPDRCFVFNFVKSQFAMPLRK